mmetsp:Transcript_118537/g.336052  ORF Transcript_118537/g.336052 Transcript_118537/m.336052 type:complete len:183 (+) Transcript_118537:94-642(+)
MPREMGDIVASASLAWQQRLEKERKHMFKHHHNWQSVGFAYEDDDIAATNDFRRTASTPSFVRSDGVGGLPRLGSASGRGSNPAADVISELSFGTSRHSKTSNSRRLRSSASCKSPTMSRRSGLSQSTLQSLREDVEQAVQEEVAKVTRPLTDQLRAEQSRRQQLEAMLTRARGGDATGASV